MGLISGGKTLLGQVKGMGGDAFNWAKNNKGQAGLAGFTLWGATDEYEEAKANGSSTAGAIAEAGFDAALGLVLGLPEYIAYEAIVNSPTLIKEGAMKIDEMKRQFGRENSAHAFSNAQFNDTEQAYTMRQAGIAIAQRSRYNTEAAMMGQEAKYMMK